MPKLVLAREAGALLRKKALGQATRAYLAASWLPRTLASSQSVVPIMYRRSSPLLAKAVCTAVRRRQVSVRNTALNGVWGSRVPVASLVWGLMTGLSSSPHWAESP